MKALRIGSAVIIGFAVTLGACGGLAPETTGGSGGSPACEAPDPLQGPRATIFPPAVTLQRGLSQEFTIQAGPGGAPTQDLRATWSVDGGAAFGEIAGGPSATANYKAPATVPSPNTATVRARLVSPNTVCASATVTIQ